MGKVVKAVGKVAGVVATVAGVATGNPGLVALGSVASKVSSVANAAGAVTDLFGGSPTTGSGTTSTQQGNTANGAYYDPFAPSRQMYADRLNTLMTNPTEATKMVTESAGYAGGNAQATKDIAAALAQKGMVGSGAEQIAYGNQGKDYFNTAYQNLISQYSILSGATNQPQSMANANALGATQQRLTDQSTMQNIQALGQLFPSTSSDTSGNATPGGYAAGATSYTPMNTSGSLNNAPNNPYGYNSNPNMGGGTMGPSWA